MRVSVYVQPELAGQATDRQLDIDRLAIYALRHALRSGRRTPPNAMTQGTAQIQGLLGIELVEQAKSGGVSIGRWVDVAITAELERQAQAGAGREHAAKGGAGRVSRRRSSGGIMSLLRGRDKHEGGWLERINRLPWIDS